MPHRKSHVLADVAEGRPRARPAGDRGRGQGARRLVAHAVARARRGLPPRRRAPLRPVALDAERRDDAQPVEDRAPGRDRRGLRDDRLLALQRRLPPPRLRGAAALADRDLEPPRVPAARGLRLRGQPVQLQLHRREPLLDARAHGLHDRLEARVDGGTLRLLLHAPPAGGRPPRRRDQPRLRLGIDDRRAPRSRARTSPASTSPARRRSSTACGRRSARTSPPEVPRLSAHRRRDRRQGLHPRAPLRRCRGGRDRGRSRLVRVPGPEVLRRLPSLRAVEHLARGT